MQQLGADKGEIIGIAQTCDKTRFHVADRNGRMSFRCAAACYVESIRECPAGYLYPPHTIRRQTLYREVPTSTRTTYRQYALHVPSHGVQPERPCTPRQT